MSPLAQAFLTGLMLRFGFLSRAEVDATWAVMVEKFGAERAAEMVSNITQTAIDALPEDAPNDLVGKAAAGAVKALVEEWAPKVETLKEVQAPQDGNPLLDVLIASWRARTSDALGDAPEAEWWNLLVERFGMEGAHERIEAAFVRASQNTLHGEADPVKQAMKVGHEIIRGLFQLVDETRKELS